MKVVLLEHTPDPEMTIALAARLCYSSSDIDGLKDKLTIDRARALIRKILRMGHHSVLEHVSFTFGIEGISRACSHQLVRHRIASYSQQSQRYVNMEESLFVIPPSIEADRKALKIYMNTLKLIKKRYAELVQMGCPIEDARYILPNATETKIIVTMNARELIHFFKLRCCRRAQWEIREVAKEMLRLVREKAYSIFQYAGPSCISGSCQEGEMSCGDPAGVREEFSRI